MVVISKSVMDTKKLGRILARRLAPGDIICLFGQLGAGKTVLAKGVAAGLGIDETEVISPSFVLMRP
ncbi:MAG: tRNA (adenosine(37)-N6)-threonylcarbamoyltransferase complex ATPase subunit type 1 TsaE, partial [Candidatus Omnitrophota bacterium]|nr:tRNA (adenosine(37)-N6)-threonylcarbamoyltransferase complex ATPase subunit type 1 TsaE [Candidatus Omnitrophota bacterium]